jgi:UDP-N-acetylmuramoyl-tripeptide--D-alanyl-D-alanine ligase
MIDVPAERLAAESGAEVAVRGSGEFAERAVVDSRDAGPGDLFFGLSGANVDGGRFASDAISAGAWGVVVDPEHAADLAADGGDRGRIGEGHAWVLSTPDPERCLQEMARAWRRIIGCPLVGITGSTGKTSVKDITRALLPVNVHASPENFNTEIGMPLALLAAPRDTDVLVMEMAMRGLGQIRQLCEIAEPDVAAITNVGPVHLELLGTLEAIVEAKAEILAGLEFGGGEGRAVVPADAEALEPHLHDTLLTFTFGPGGDVFAEGAARQGERMRARVGTPHGEADFEFGFTEEHNLRNALCAIAIGVALDLDPAAMAANATRIQFSRLRGERIALHGGILLLNDCYNANPISMRAALEHLASEPAPGGGRHLAILGGMAELGPDGPDFHEQVAELARGLGISPLIGVGELARDYAPDEWVETPGEAAAMAAGLLEDGDIALIKGSRSVGLELVAEVLAAELGAEAPDDQDEAS